MKNILNFIYRSQRALKVTALALVAFVFPLVSYAQDITNLIDQAGDWITSITPIVAALALLYFFWGVAKFMLNSANSGDREEGKRHMMWGIVALFVIFSVWGLVFFLVDSTGVQPEHTLVPPAVYRR